jgi:hypothetical protein
VPEGDTGSATVSRGATAPEPARVLVGMIDSGWDRTIADARVLPGVGLISRTKPLEAEFSADDHDALGHGTRCTGILLDENPNCHIIPVRVFGNCLETSPQILAKAIDWSCDTGIRLLNLSLGTTRRDAAPLLYAACDRASSRGVVIVAAAGRGDALVFPATFEPVISVGWGSGDPTFIQYHPGSMIECEVWSGARAVRGLAGAPGIGWGTSLAAPVVTALVASWMAESPIDLDGVRERLARLPARIPLSTDSTDSLHKLSL